MKEEYYLIKPGYKIEKEHFLMKASSKVERSTT